MCTRCVRFIVSVVHSHSEYVLSFSNRPKCNFISWNGRATRIKRPRSIGKNVFMCLVGMRQCVCVCVCAWMACENLLHILIGMEVRGRWKSVGCKIQFTRVYPLESIQFDSIRFDAMHFQWRNRWSYISRFVNGKLLAACHPSLGNLSSRMEDTDNVCTLLHAIPFRSVPFHTRPHTHRHLMEWMFDLTMMYYIWLP